MTDKNLYLEKSIQLAKTAYQNWDFPVGWVLLIDDKNEVCWQNKVVSKNNPILHAEIDIIIKSWIYKNSQNKKIFVSMEPCERCAKALVEYWIDEVYYILEDPSWWWKKILESNWIKVFQIKHNYEQYLDLFIDFLNKSKRFAELLPHYLSIKKNKINCFNDSINNDIKNRFQITDSNDSTYSKIKEIIFNNTELYLKNALLRNSKDMHNSIIKWYDADQNRIADYCFNEFINKKDDALNEDLIKWLHKNLYPEGFFQKFKDEEWIERVWMMPWEYREIVLISNDNQNNDIYLKPDRIKDWMRQLLENYNNNSIIKEAIIYLLVDFFIIHPFWDGNGRVAYILADLLFLKNKLEPLYLWKIKENDKKGFYKILDEIYATRRLHSFYDFIEKYKLNDN